MIDFPAAPTDGQVFSDWVFNTTKGAWNKRGVSSAGYLLGAIYPWTGPTIPAWGLELAGQTIVGGVSLYSGIAALNPAWCVGADLVIPDWRGRLPVGQKPGDANFATLGSLVGEAAHTLTIAEMPSHKHDLPGGIVTPGTLAGDVAATTASGAAFGFRYLVSPAAAAMSNAGGGAAHNVVQPSVVARWVICAVSSSGNFDTTVQSALVLRVTSLESLRASAPVQGIIPASVVLGSGSTSASVSADGTITFTACTSLSLNGMFDGLGSDLYAFYFQCLSSVDLINILARWRGAGSDYSAASGYGSQYAGIVSGTASAGSSAALTAMYFAYGRILTGNTAVGIISKPGLAAGNIKTLKTDTHSYGYVVYQMGNYSSSSLGPMDGLTLLTSSGTMTGTLKIVKI